MITKFKIFENVSLRPEVGDWVMIDGELYKDGAKIFYNYIKDKIFQIKEINRVQGGTDKRYKLIIENVPDEIDKIFNKNREWESHCFKCWSNSKEELEQLLTNKKYNI